MASGDVQRASKRVRLMSDDESSGGSDAEGLDLGLLKVNTEYAKRFEHNKKREERQKLEEKYGKESASDSDSESETEDDEAVLATEELDAEIYDVLNAIKSKDPRAYDKNATFYKTPVDAPNGVAPSKKEKPLRLQDYHRQNLLNGMGMENDDDEKEEDGDVQMTYTEEQAALKRDVVKSMHDAAEDDQDQSGSEVEDLFTRKGGQDEPKPKVSTTEVDLTIADRDPETYLSNFMAARAWVPGKSSKFQPFESDDESDDERAEAFEAAYNMRFEDPARANEKLLTHSRQAAEKYSVRREDAKGRKRAREREKEAKEAARREREEDKARLRKLKIDEAQEKLERFKKVAGLHGKDITDEEWAQFVNADWDDAQWNQEMAKRFGDDYYEDGDMPGTDEEDDDVARSKKKAKKPKFDDDIDIADLVPEFDEDVEREALQKYKLTDDEADNGEDSDGGVKLSVSGDDEEGEEARAAAKQKRTKRVVEQMRREQKKQARKEKMKIAELVDENLVTDDAMVKKSTKGGVFRYRETSPGAFGLSARDILMADDSQLNQFAGLKKMAAFRDAEKKRKDKKRLGKKARLRQWRRETFGDDSGPQMTFQEFLASQMPEDERAERVARKHGQVDVSTGNIEAGLPAEKKKKKRSRKRKADA